ncbi:MAG: hypothetical protein SynsKO_30040 [Synoicihabitans sp.]
MLYSIVIRPVAEHDLTTAADWYDEQRMGLGDKFLDEINAAMNGLVNQPDISPRYYGDFRRILLHRFPYKIFYQIHDTRVIVFRVLHAKQSHANRLS